jgi:hypothetical protein
VLVQRQLEKLRVAANEWVWVLAVLRKLTAAWRAWPFSWASSCQVSCRPWSFSARCVETLLSFLNYDCTHYSRAWRPGRAFGAWIVVHHRDVAGSPVGQSARWVQKANAVAPPILAISQLPRYNSLDCSANPKLLLHLLLPLFRIAPHVQRVQPKFRRGN